MRKLTPPATRFWAKVIKTDADSCWEWTGSKSGPGWHEGNGYGQFALKATKPIIRVKAHRYSYELTFGPIPPDTDVLHKCDNPGCVNPNHLSLGSHSDNMLDMYKKKRRKLGSCCMPGEMSPNAILTLDTVMTIKRMLRDGVGVRPTARQLGLKRHMVANIHRGISWKHIL